MKLDDVPFVGNLSRKISAIAFNLVLLGIVCLVLGVLIIFVPTILQILVSALLIVMGLIFFNIAYHINSQKRKYFDWMGK
jgi:uncharacterized membrane protein